MGFKKNIKKKVRTGVWGPSQRGFGWQTAGTELFSFRLFSQMLQDRDLDLEVAQRPAGAGMEPAHLIEERADFQLVVFIADRHHLVQGGFDLEFIAHAIPARPPPMMTTW